MNPLRTPTMKLILLLTLLFCSTATAQTSDLGIGSRYDRFKDETTYRLTESLMPDRAGYVLLSFETVYKGANPRLKRPSAATIILESYTDNWYFLKTDNTFRFIQDGQRASL